MKRIITITFYTIYILIISKSFSQSHDLGKVTVAELQEKRYQKDTTAVAAYFINKGKSTFVYQKQGFSEVHEYSFKVKIYKKEGLSYANVTVPYYTGYKNINNDVVKFHDGITYNLENGTIVKTKLKSEGSFDKKINEYWSEASIAMPNVKVGSIIEYKYTVYSENVVKFPLFNFQYDIPVSYAEYVTEVPEFFIYSPIQSGFQKINTETKLGFGYQNYDDKNNQGLRMSYQQINSIHIAENIAALKEEAFVDNLNNYRLSLDYELQKTRFPETPEKIFTQTWEDVARSIYKEKEFGDELNKRGYFEDNLILVTSKATTDLEKAEAIFKFVQRKMNWNKHYSYSTENGVVKAYQTETGNSADINFILISMLNKSLLTAYPVLISTVNHGIAAYPNRTLFNSVIAAVEIDGKKILMDATSKFSTLDLLPLNDLNWTGRLINRNNVVEEINLVPQNPSKIVSNAMITIDDKNIIKGKVRIQKTNHEALKMRLFKSSLSNESYLEKIENSFNDIKIDDYVIENFLTDLSKPVTETFNFVSNNHLEHIGNKIFINPLLIFTESKNPFVQENRELPVYFGFPHLKKFNLSITIPENYSIESIPQAISLSMPNNVASFVFKIVANENVIQVATTTEINIALMSGDYYDVLKEFYKQMIAKLTEKIVLVKKM